MPRDGANIYHRPPGTDAVPDTTIESSKYNAYVADIEQDLNTPRPIVAGGTGASDARSAMIALSGEIAKQVVTNFDMTSWVNGSFYAAVGATAGPPSGGTTVNRFAGIYYANADDSYATVEARDQTTGIRYVRNKIAGSWGAWAQGAGSVADLDAAYVNVAGDTMTGPLTVNSSIQTIGARSFFNANNETYAIGLRYISTDAMVYLGATHGVAPNSADFVVSNTSGAELFRVKGDTSGVVAGGGGTTGTYYFGNSGTKTLSYDGTNFIFSGANLYLPGTANAAFFGGPVFAGYSIAGGKTGVYYFGNDGTKYLQSDGTSFNLVGGSSLVIGNNAAANLTLNSSSTPALAQFGIASNGANKWAMGTQVGDNTGNFSLYSYVLGKQLVSFLENGAVNFTSGGPVSHASIRVGTSSASGLPEIDFHYFNGTSQWGTTYQDFGGGPTAACCEFYKGGSQVGAISINATNTSFLTTSDLALKDVKGAYDASEAIRIIRADPVRAWNWKATGEAGVGWVAQYSHAVDPDLAVPPPVMEMPKGSEIEVPQMHWGIDYGRRTPYLWAAVSQLLDRIDQLEAKIAAMEAAG